MRKSYVFSIFVVGAFAGLSCFPEGFRLVGADMADAGREMLGDALVEGGATMEHVGDATVSDARADEPTSTYMDVPCSTTFTRTDTVVSGDMETTITWTRLYAEIRDPRVAPGSPPFVDAVLCGYEQSPAPVACPDGHRCTGMLPRAATCTTMTAEIDLGLVRVYCGESIETRVMRVGGTPMTTSSVRNTYHNARISVRFN